MIGRPDQRKVANLMMTRLVSFAAVALLTAAACAPTALSTPIAPPTSPPPTSPPPALFVVSGSVTSAHGGCVVGELFDSCDPNPVVGANLLITGPVTVSLVSSSTGTFSTQLPAGQYTLTAGPVLGLWDPLPIVFNVLVNQTVAPIDIVYNINCEVC